MAAGDEGLRIIPVHGIGEITPDVELDAVLAEAFGPAGGGPELLDGDVLVVTQKIVSKAEGRLVNIDADDPAAKVRLVEQESVPCRRRLTSR